MNQILYTGGKNKKGGTIDAKKIIIIFVIFLIIFGVCLIGLGLYLKGKVKPGDTTGSTTGNNIGNTDTPINPEEPEKSKIEIEFESQVGAVKVIINSNKNLSEVSYWWDEEEPTVVETEETQYEVEIPSKQGTHTLYIEVTDEAGYLKTEEQVVIGDAGPEVTISTDRVSNYIIKAKDDEKLDKIVIVLNGETQEIDVDSKEFEHKVAIPQGYSLIEVTAYNLNGLSTKKKAKISNFGG